MASGSQIRSALEKEFELMRKISELFEAQLRSAADDVTMRALAMERVWAKEMPTEISAGLKAIEKEMAAYMKAADKELARLTKSYDRELAKLRRAKERAEKKAKPAAQKATARKTAARKTAAKKAKAPARKSPMPSRRTTLGTTAPTRRALPVPHSPWRATYRRREACPCSAVQTSQSAWPRFSRGSKPPCPHARNCLPFCS